MAENTLVSFSRKITLAINAGTLVDQLLQIVRTQLDAQEQRLLNNIAEQWEVHMVPRDAFVHQAIKATRGW